jgi:phosphotransferase system enzyme I (PtsI)
MISGVEEVLEVKKIIRTIKRELAQKKIPYQDKVPIGIMIEVPAAVMTASLLAREVDFFSIGTNDLIQYGLAIDRVNELVSDLYNPFHPAVLRMIYQTTKAAKEAHIPVAVCGEMAGDPLAIALFVAMELDSLSMNPISIPRVKKILRALTREKSKRLLEEIMELTTTDEVERHLKKDIGHLLPLPTRQLSLLKIST